ncbi:acylphosphatase [Gilliamella sp. B2717]|uniref:acylphosphatase n=1 Tax=unclassified Gilliamella TaxID=2685620 RepID=UPI00226A7477|nr:MULTISPECIES: acylphosphatase [unclassified Gilliamella]MCX8573763.1 acylphosphatase [Gilliamella sp. B3831]MCX8575609.1 acylphosphatase [Gilliamella sp. B3815]MCX8578087.1 acylphosphatase [Gilliamella sp. B2717]MCX8589810.1 acylphosphatase [Gilliamella sp. B3812]MCX8602711.1 acylphosphatase [Gilliamella sp. B3823]
MIRLIKIIVSGSVQGVGFRFFTYQQAVKIGLVGYVKNLENGAVEIIAQGNNQQISQLILWFEHGGPRSARITQINMSELPLQENLTSFNVRY